MLEINGLAEASSFILRPDGGPSEQLLGFLRLLNLSGEHAIDSAMTCNWLVKGGDPMWWGSACPSLPTLEIQRQLCYASPLSQ